MIRKQDILDRAAEWQLRPDVVEKDYVLGWLLAGLAAHPETRTYWILKGGTCIKKCYFETYRFSEDLDISLLPEAPYTETALREALQAVARLASEMSGVDFPHDLVSVRSHQDKHGRLSFQGRIAYRGPLGIRTFPRVLFDITQHEPVFDPPHMKIPFHPYPDILPDGGGVLTYSLNELLAEKTRALYERTRPRDLYDVVYLLDNLPEVFNFAHVRALFRKKCTAKQLEIPSAAGLLQVVHSTEELRTEWGNMLVHQLPALPTLDDLLQRVPTLLRWIDEPVVTLFPEEERIPAPIPSGASIAPAGIQYWGTGFPLEVIRFAGANRLLVEFVYDGKLRLAEPYSLRRATTGNLLFYGCEQGEAHIKAFNVAKMSAVRLTNTSFHPRYRIELSLESPLSAPPAATPTPRILPSPHRSHGTSRRLQTKSGRTYVFACSYCRKRFRHSANNSTLRKHKAKGGTWDCPGRQGFLVSID